MDLNTRAWSNATVNGLMAWMTDNQATGEDGARYFLQNNEDICTVLAIGIGIPVGILMSRSDRMQSIVNPILDVMQTMPSFV